MDKLDVVREWLSRAKSTPAKAKQGRGNSEIYLEDLCFDAQQAIEKSLKGFLIFEDIDFPKTHSIGDLLTLLMQNGVTVSGEIKESAGGQLLCSNYQISGRLGTGKRCRL